MKLEITSLKNAVQSLKIALDEFEKHKTFLSKTLVYNALNITYELSHKLLKRQLEAMSAAAETIDTMSFQHLIRHGAETGLLLHSWDVWKKYREARNATSHAYNEEKANEVFEIIPDFYREAKYLLEKLETHNEQ